MRKKARHIPARARAAGAPPALFWLLCLALCVRSLAPDGYMFGSLANGWPVVLCPEGLPPGFLVEAAPARGSPAGHAHHGGSPQRVADSAHAPAAASTAALDHDAHAGPRGDDMAQHCPWSSALDKPALAQADTAVLPVPSISLPAARAASVGVIPRRLRSYRGPRAPPSA